MLALERQCALPLEMVMGDVAMAYQLYAIDSSRRSLLNDLNASDDSEAIQLVVLRQEPTDTELWCDGRKVAVCPHGRMPSLVAEQRASA